MELKEAIFHAHRITEEIRNYVRKDELSNLWNCIIDNIEPLRNTLDVICKHYPEDRWTPTSEKMPKPNELVWVCDKHHEVDVCQLHEYMDSDWYDSNDEWLYYRDSVIAWRPYLIPEPYEPEEVIAENVWYPVSKNPPKKESHYWVQLCDSNGKYAGMHECILSDSGRIDVHTKTDWHWIGNPQYTKIVAWRKLPDIYTEEEQ